MTMCCYCNSSSSITNFTFPFSPFSKVTVKVSDLVRMNANTDMNRFGWRPGLVSDWGAGPGAQRAPDCPPNEGRPSARARKNGGNHCISSW